MGGEGEMLRRGYGPPLPQGEGRGEGINPICALSPRERVGVRADSPISA